MTELMREQGAVDPISEVPLIVGKEISAGIDQHTSKSDLYITATRSGKVAAIVGAHNPLVINARVGPGNSIPTCSILAEISLHGIEICLRGVVRTGLEFYVSLIEIIHHSGERRNAS